MPTVFADTGFWIALLNPRDILHQVARELDASPLIDHVVMSEMVLTEFLNDSGARGPTLRQAASRFLSELQKDAGVTIIPQTSRQFWEAASVFADRLDKGWSLTDCPSFAVMQELALQDALTYDRHFEQMGFRALLRRQ